MRGASIEADAAFTGSANEIETKHDSDIAKKKFVRSPDAPSYTSNRNSRGIIGRETKIKHYEAANPNVLLYECMKDTCSSDVDDQSVWRVYGWY